MADISQRYGQKTQAAYDRVIRKLERLEYMISAVAATIWGGMFGFCFYILIDFLVN